MKKVILILSVVIILGVTFILFNINKKDKEEKPYAVSSLTELFPASEMTQKFKDVDGKYEVDFSKPSVSDGVTTINANHDIKDADGNKVTVKMTYVITNEKVIESGEYISDGKVVSIIYPTELIVGVPYVNMTWKSVDGLVTNTVVSMKNNQVTIESIKEIYTYEENGGSPVKKIFKETRIYEKGKGIILYRTEIVDDTTSVTETKIID
jgi:uncharacterized protein YxeA